MLCYRFTVRYYSYQVWQAQEACPRPQPAAGGSFAATATAGASRVWSAQNAIVKLPRTAQVLAEPALPGAVAASGSISNNPPLVADGHNPRGMVPHVSRVRNLRN